MNVEEAKKALINKKPVIISRPLLGDVYQGCICGITMRAPKDRFELYVETKDAVARAVTVSGLDDVRYANEEEIKDFLDRYFIASKIQPQLNYEIDPRQSVYKVFKNMSLYDMAVFLTKTFVISNKADVSDKEVFNSCLRETVKFLESEAKI